MISKIKFVDAGFYASLIPLDENIFAMYINNISGNEPYKLNIYDNNGNIINRYPNYNSFKKIEGGFLLYNCLSYKWKNEVNFYEPCVDTLFKISKNNLIPYYRFQLGKYNQPYSERGNIGTPEKLLIFKYISFTSIVESDSFIFLLFFMTKKIV